MEEAGTSVSSAIASEDARLASLGYKPQLNRVLGLFSNFAVAFTYLSPMVGIYSLFVLGVGTGGPAYIWLTFIPLIGMLFVALVFGELASHYPVAGALYQYSKFSVGPGFGWFVGWFYGMALLITVASVDFGVVGYVTSLTHNWFGWNFNPAHHSVILVVVLILLAIQTTLNITGTRVMARVAQIGVYVEILGTFGIFLILAIHGFHHGLGFLFTTQGVQHAAIEPTRAQLQRQLARCSADRGARAGLHLLRIRVGRRHLRGDEGRRPQVPRAMRLALIWGGIASLFLTAGSCSRCRRTTRSSATVKGGGVPFLLGQLSSGMQDFLLVLIIFAFFSCGTSVQGAGSRLAFSFSRDGALPGFVLDLQDPQALQDAGQRAADRCRDLAAVRAARVLQPEPQRPHLVHHLPGEHERPRVARLVRRQRHLSLVPAHGARRDDRARPRLGPRGQLPAREWGWTVSIIAALYLGLMFVNVVVPTGLSSPRAYFNIDWITLLVMAIIAVVGAIYFLAARPDKKLSRHVHDDLEPTGAERAHVT